MPNRMRDRNECHSVLNERQIAKALFEGRLVPGCRLLSSDWSLTAGALIGTQRNFCNNFRVADQPPGISVSLQVENKQFIGNGHLIGSSLR
jgi:hypothetical protein